MTNRTKSEFTSHFRIAAKTNMLLLFPTRYAHARYRSRMIDRFLNWGDHGKPKSGKIKGRCQPPPGSASRGYSLKTKLGDRMIKRLLNSVIAKYRDLSVSRRSIICLSLRLRQIIGLLATDRSRYFSQPRPIIVNYFT